jgi:purine-cytosine permease-like protein
MTPTLKRVLLWVAGAALAVSLMIGLGLWIRAASNSKPVVPVQSTASTATVATTTLKPSTTTTTVVVEYQTLPSSGAFGTTRWLESVPDSGSHFN